MLKGFGIYTTMKEWWSDILDLRQGDCLELMKDIPDRSIDMIVSNLPCETSPYKWNSSISAADLWNEYVRIQKDDAAIIVFKAAPSSTMCQMEHLIREYTNKGDTILANCTEVSSIYWACSITERNLIGIKLDEKYLHIAKERIEKARAEHEILIRTDKKDDE